jgi:hypothetical protein
MTDSFPYDPLLSCCCSTLSWHEILQNYCSFCQKVNFKAFKKNLYRSNKISIWEQLLHKIKQNQYENRYYIGSKLIWVFLNCYYTRSKLNGGLGEQESLLYKIKDQWEYQISYYTRRPKLNASRWKVTIQDQTKLAQYENSYYTRSKINGGRRTHQLLHKIKQNWPMRTVTTQDQS